MLSMLDLLSRRPEGTTAAEAVRESGFTQNLVFRLLKTLVAMGFASQREDDRAYVLTHRLLELAAPRQGEKSLALCSHDSLRWLRDETGETVQLAIEAGGKAMILEQFRGTHALQVSGEVGMRVPLYSCAPGKAILASWNENRREIWFQDRGREMKRFTKTTLSRRQDLEDQLEEVRAQGYAIDRAEGIEGIHCVAAVIKDSYGQQVGAVTVMAPIGRMAEKDFQRFAQYCREAVKRIERKLHL
tara:strand:+ start:2511 stop:3242 length:732 start_codon:yes stop_codon:yes gene_type:complete